jgi:DNA-binding PadR family transcriptional regulator
MSPREPVALTNAMFSVLLSIGSRPLHGWAIMKEIEKRTNGAEMLLPGSLYNTISRMLDAGLVREAKAPADAPDDDAKRRYYRITAAGRRAAAAEAERLESLLRMARDEGFLGRGRSPA